MHASVHITRREKLKRKSKFKTVIKLTAYMFIGVRCARVIGVTSNESFLVR